MYLIEQSKTPWATNLLIWAQELRLQSAVYSAVASGRLRCRRQKVKTLEMRFTIYCVLGNLEQHRA